MTSESNPIDTKAGGHFRDWGLLPTPQYGQTQHWATWLRYYFVEFNPLYFISTCCILYGVSLVARNVGAFNLHSANLEQLLLFTTTQLYEAALIAGAAILARWVRAKRPAVLLCLLECVMLFDCTFRLESVVLLGAFGVCLILCWILLTCVKVWALAKTMRIALSWPHYAAIVVTAAAIAGIVSALSYPGFNKLLVLQAAAWLGTFVIMALEVKRPAALSVLSGSSRHSIVAERCVKGAYRILIGFYLYHIWAYILLAVEPELRMAAIYPQASAFLLLHLITSKKEPDLWIFAFLMLASTCFTSVATVPCLLVIAAAYTYRVVKGAHSNFAVGAACSLYAAVWLFDWQGLGHAWPHLPAALEWPTVMLAAALAGIAIFMRNKIARGALAVGGLYASYPYVSTIQWLPTTELGRGVLIVCAGFVVLAIGIGINWLFKVNSGDENAAGPAGRESFSSGGGDCM